MADIEGACLFHKPSQLLQEATVAFTREFGGSPDVASCAPGRVNLIGEHTDYSDGFVFPMALPMATVVVGRRNDSTKSRVFTSSKDVDQPFVDEFSHDLSPGLSSPKWANYVKGVVACFGGSVPSFDAVISSAVPLGGGLSSSASLEVAMFTFLEALTGRTADPKDKALACQKAEHQYAGMPCGIMDQFISTMGKEGHALLLDCRSMDGQLVPLSDPDLKVLITNSNVKHELSSSEYPVRRSQCEQAASILKVAKLRDATISQLESQKSGMDGVIFRRAHHVISENERCVQGAKYLADGKLSEFGKLMLLSHESLRDDFQVSCAELDSLVSLAMEVDGVYGSRMTGGGFGGCTVTLVKQQSVQNVINYIKDCYEGRPTFYICDAASGARVLPLTS